MNSLGIRTPFGTELRRNTARVPQRHLRIRNRAAPRSCRRTFAKRADTQYWDTQIAIPSGIRMLPSPRRNPPNSASSSGGRQSPQYRRIREQSRLPRAVQCKVILCSINADDASGWVLLMAVFPILFGFLACAVTSLALGITVIRLLRIELNRAEAVCIGYALGSAATSMLVFGVAAAWIAREGLFLAWTASSFVLLLLQLKWLRGLKPAALGTIPAGIRIIFGVAWVAYGVLYFRQAVSPEISPDGMAYHLGLVNLWSHAHGLSRNLSMYAALPDGMEMLYLFAFSIGRHSAAALVHFSFLMLLPWLMLLFGCRFGWPHGGAALAALLVFASPLIGMDGTAAYNDVALALTVFGAVYLLESWRHSHNDGALMGSSFLAGFAFALKYTAGFFTLFVAGTILWEFWRIGRVAARFILIGVVAMAIAPATYLIRNAVWYQNPIAFFGNSIFRNPWFHISFERGYIEGMSHLRGVTLAELPRELTVGGDKIGESFGPAFALLPLGLVGLAWPRSRVLVLAAMFAACAFAANKSGRFLIPAAPLLAMSAAFVICRLPGSSMVAVVLTLAHLVVSWPSINNKLKVSSGWRIVYHIPWSAALRIEPERHYLMRSDPYLIAQLIETYVPDGQPVLVFSDIVAQSYTTRPILVPWESAFAEKMTDWIRQASNTPGYGRTWTVNFPLARVRGLRLVQTGQGGEDAMWGINEVRMWNGETAVRPKTSWKLNADPNPWDVPLLVDGSEVTRWRSWEGLRPGMWVEMRFDASETIDRAEIVCNDGQWDSRMEASVLNDGGHWSPGGPSSWRVNQLVDLRREATQALKRSGVHYLEMSLQAWNDKPFRGDVAAWGVRLVASTPRSVLLAVD